MEYLKQKEKCKEKGFTLVETLIVLGFIMMAMTLKYKELQRDLEFNQAKIAGEQIKQVASAANNYISIRYSELTQMQSASGTAKDLGPRTCSGNVCTITTATLVNEGLLPSSFNGKNVNGSNYSIQLKRNGIAPNYVINGLVVTNNAWSEGRLIRHDLLGRAMQYAGSDSGVSKNNSSISGYAGVWSSNKTDYSIINKAGQLAQRVGYDSGMYTVYLRRDGTLPMTGALNLDGNDINNVANLNATGDLRTTNNIYGKTINSSGDIYAGGKISANGEIFAKNGYGDSIAIGGDAGSNDYEIRLGSAKPLSVYSPNATDYTTILKTGRGNVQFSQRLGLMGTNPNVLPAGWSGGLTTTDVYANGTVGLGSGGNVAAYMNSAGNIYASNNITSNTVNANGIRSNGDMSAGGNFSSNTVYSNYIKSNGNMDVAGSFSSNTVNANNIASNGELSARGRMIAGEYLLINGKATANAGCSPNGLVGVENGGALLSCQSGKWLKLGGSSSGGGGGGGSPQLYQCPLPSNACNYSGSNACRGQISTSSRCQCRHDGYYLSCTPI